MANDLGWRELLLIGGSLKAGLFQALAKKEYSASELADNLNYSPRAVKITLEALASLGYLNNSQSNYSLTQKSRKLFIDKQADEYCVGSVMHSLRLINNWLKLDQAIITGKSQSSARSAEELSYFIDSMNEGARKGATEVVSKVLAYNKGAKNLLDLGGGPGTYSKEFAEKGLEVTLLDTAAVIDIVEKDLKNYRNIRLGRGDFHRELPPGEFDIVLMANITHIYNPDKNVALFEKAKKSLSNSGILAIVDYARGISPGAELFAVNMLVNTAGGGTWTEEQYRRWLGEAGLKTVLASGLKKSQTLIIAKP
jgi:SAM-dependent methyltransferase